MMRDVFVFTSVPLPKAGGEAGAYRFEENGGAVMGPQHAGADQRESNQRAGDE
jgi:hypothetical protein